MAEKKKKNSENQAPQADPKELENLKKELEAKEEELKADLEKRLGLKIIRIEVGNVDFLKDSAIIKIYYEPIMDEFGTIDTVMKTGKIR